MSGQLYSGSWRVAFGEGHETRRAVHGLAVVCLDDVTLEEAGPSRQAIPVVTNAISAPSRSGLFIARATMLGISKILTSNGE